MPFSHYRTASGLALAAVIAATLISGLWLYHTGRETAHEHARLRDAQAARADLLETLLEPVVSGAAQRRMRRLAELRGAVSALGLRDALALVDDEGRAIAAGDEHRVRLDDAHLNDVLDAESRNSDAASLRQQIRIVLGSGSLIVLSVLTFIFYVRAAVREQRRLEAQETLAIRRGRALATVQRALFNRELPAVPALGLHGRYVPAANEMRVGGDWYDVIRLPDRRVFISIGDVAGHGLEAAVHMDTARQAILAAALHENDPAAILSSANAALTAAAAPMVTAICGFVDPAVGDVVYSTAGHPPPLLVDAQKSSFLAYDGLPLGIEPDAKYAMFSHRVPTGAMLVFYTDGLIEHKRDIIAGEARLLDASRSAYGADDPAATIERIVFSGRVPVDDVAILTIVMRDDSEDGATVGALRIGRLPPSNPA